MKTKGRELLRAHDMTKEIRVRNIPSDIYWRFKRKADVEHGTSALCLKLIREYLQKGE